MLQLKINVVFTACMWVFCFCRPWILLIVLKHRLTNVCYNICNNNWLACLFNTIYVINTIYATIMKCLQIVINIMLKLWRWSFSQVVKRSAHESSTFNMQLCYLLGSIAYVSMYMRRTRVPRSWSPGPGPPGLGPGSGSPGPGSRSPGQGPRLGRGSWWSQVQHRPGPKYRILNSMSKHPILSSMSIYSYIHIVSIYTSIYQLPISCPL